MRECSNQLIFLRIYSSSILCRSTCKQQAYFRQIIRRNVLYTFYIIPILLKTILLREIQPTCAGSAGTGAPRTCLLLEKTISSGSMSINRSLYASMPSEAAYSCLQYRRSDPARSPLHLQSFDRKSVEFSVNHENESRCSQLCFYQQVRSTGSIYFLYTHYTGMMKILNYENAPYNNSRSVLDFLRRKKRHSAQ